MIWLVPPRLVIFDCDGVLVDSEGISNDVLAAALRGVGVEISGQEAHDRYRGMFLSEIRADAERQLGAIPGVTRIQLGREATRLWSEEIYRELQRANRAAASPDSGAIEDLKILLSDEAAPATD